MDALPPVDVEKILGAMALVENPKSATGKGSTQQLSKMFLD